ncbi:uncharacterized protein PV09_08642 [Verruconis gallopava]|uniref:SAM-dependent MTase RsmB/NOP-type domain-containing protein n=1 Tax=Verruconis gallopava TaxID=253628 RepID=A0A0D1YG22_9PEZI|nr:uncharacterized protein PV09_08642 [Verruconis gallopava]KIV99711.1 hypothetical protein PV09_08642 [Verruconis gallopava]
MLSQQKWRQVQALRKLHDGHSATNVRQLGLERLDDKKIDVMSLYHEASTILTNENRQGGSLKSRVFGSRNLKNPPAKVYALLVQSLKWSPILKDVIDRSQILSHERKLSPALAVLLVHDLLVSSSGIAAPRNHPLRVAIERHKVRLSAEFTRCRIRHGFGTIEAFRKHVESQIHGANQPVTGSYPHPRWVRVNSLRTTLETQLGTAFHGYRRVETLSEIQQASPREKVLYVDHTVPDLLALAPGHDMTQIESYRKGELIIQDKASCFPAYLLNPATCNGDIIDTCAAPGNKTTHLAALLYQTAGRGNARKIFAFERNSQRSRVLQTMVARAGGDKLITVFGSKDFLSVDLDDPGLKDVGSLLLDPSCSGTGIVGRDDEPTMHLPTSCKNSNVRKTAKNRKDALATPNSLSVHIDDDDVGDDAEESELVTDDVSLKERLRALSAFQLQLVLRAMQFPRASRITYSTCSIHSEENELVVLRALTSTIAVERGWQIMRRDEQPAGLREWHVRGDVDSCLGFDSGLSKTAAAEIADACIRCEKGTKDGTMGFFVAGFVRCRGSITSGEQRGVNPTEADRQHDCEEWTGFSDAEN